MSGYRLWDRGHAGGLLREESQETPRQGSSGNPGMARTAKVCSLVSSLQATVDTATDLQSQEQIKAEESIGEDKGKGQEKRHPLLPSLEPSLEKPCLPLSLTHRALELASALQSLTSSHCVASASL